MSHPVDELVIKIDQASGKLVVAVAVMGDGGGAVVVVAWCGVKRLMDGGHDAISDHNDQV
jgi:hypothetical protein